MQFWTERKYFTNISGILKNLFPVSISPSLMNEHKFPQPFISSAEVVKQPIVRISVAGT